MKVKEVLFKFIFLFFLFNLSFSEIAQNQYIHKNIVPINNSKHIFGISSYKNEKIKNTLLYQTWFSDNLIFSTSLIPEFNMKDRLLKYSFSIGYNISYLDKIVKNIIIDIGYNRSRFNNNNFDDIKNISIGVNTTFKSYKFLYNLSYNYYEDIENFNRFSFSILIPTLKNYIFQIGINLDFDKEEYYYIPFISILYQI